MKPFRIVLCVLLPLQLALADDEPKDGSAADLRRMLEEMQPGFRALGEGRAGEALAIWSGLAERDFAPAQHNLALLYEKGQGTPQNLVQALQWFLLAELNGHARSRAPRERVQGVLPAESVLSAFESVRARIAGDLLGARGVNARRYAALLLEYPRDEGAPPEDSYVWYSVAAALGDARAIADRDRIAADLAPARLVELQDLATRIFDGRLPTSTRASEFPSATDQAQAPRRRPSS